MFLQMIRNQKTTVQFLFVQSYFNKRLGGSIVISLKVLLDFLALTA